MQQNSDPTVGRADGDWGWSLRFIGLKKVLGGLLFLALLHHSVQAFGDTISDSYSATLQWDANSSSEQVVGYRVYYGAASQSYTNLVEAGTMTVNTIPGLVGGVNYFFAVTAYNAEGLESSFSSEVSYMPGAPRVRTLVTPAGQVVLTVQGLMAHTYDILASQNLVDWIIVGTVTLGSGGSVNFTDTNAANFQMRFYRAQEHPPAVQVRVASNRQGLLTVTGQNGHTYHIQATQDFQTWTQISTVMLGTGGSVAFADPSAGSYPSRFYRIHETQP